jgi:hypothetical protein
MDQYVTVDAIRDYLMDRTVDDNEIDFDLTFEDAEIEKAMAHALRDYNSVKPISIGGNCDPAQLPADTNIFFDGTIAHLYTSLIAKLSRNDVDVVAGGVKVNINAKRIEHLARLRKQHRDDFLEAATARKLTLNLRKCFGRVG